MKHGWTTSRKQDHPTQTPHNKSSCSPVHSLFVGSYSALIDRAQASNKMKVMKASPLLALLWLLTQFVSAIPNAKHVDRLRGSSRTLKGGSSKKSKKTKVDMMPPPEDEPTPVQPPTLIGVDPFPEATMLPETVDGREDFDFFADRPRKATQVYKYILQTNVSVTAFESFQYF
jgi:hypothetical protein